MTVFDIDPNVVKPGWTPFIITLVLAAVMVVLYRSMRRQFGRIRTLPRDRTPQPRDVGGAVRRDVSIRPEDWDAGADRRPDDRSPGPR